MLLLGDGVVSYGDELVAHVPHQEGDAPSVGPPWRDTQRGVVDRRRSGVHQPGRPHPAGPAPDVARDAHREVRGRVEVLDDAALVIDDDLLEPGAGAGVGRGVRP